MSQTAGGPLAAAERNERGPTNSRVEKPAAPGTARVVPSAPSGHGIGLRRSHFTSLLEHGVRGVPWMEIVSENFFEPGGRPWAVLNKVRQEVPVVLHGVSMAIGNVAPVPDTYLDQLASLVERLEPTVVSDHLCWCGYDGQQSHDLLPLPCTEEALTHVVEQVDRVQTRLGRQILIENVSSYVTYRQSDMPEWTFLTEIAKRADCGILLDVNNVFVSANNHGFSATEYIDNIPPERVGQLHLAGHTDKGTFLLDSHIGPVPDGVWDLYKHTVQKLGRVPSLVEWDEDVPDYETVVADAHRAARLEAEVLDGL